MESEAKQKTGQTSARALVESESILALARNLAVLLNAIRGMLWTTAIVDVARGRGY